jgi:hypothetical protein
MDRGRARVCEILMVSKYNNVHFACQRGCVPHRPGSWPSTIPFHHCHQREIILTSYTPRDLSCFSVQRDFHRQPTSLVSLVGIVPGSTPCTCIIFPLLLLQFRLLGARRMTGISLGHRYRCASSRSTWNSGFESHSYDCSQGTLTCNARVHRPYPYLFTSGQL